MRRYAAILTIALAVAVAALAIAPVAGAVQPVREGLPSAPFTLDQSVCGFPVAFTYPKNNEFITTFSNGEQIITGALFATLTNTDTQKSITVNISGPGFFVTDANGVTTLRFAGRSLFYFLPGQLGAGQPGVLILTSGAATLVFDANGNNLSSDITNPSTQDICAALADR
jgi:hypothetical protein